MGSLGFSIYITMPSVIRDFYFYSNLDALYFLFMLNCFAKTSTMMLNRNGKSGYSYLVPNFNRKAFNLLSLNMMFIVLFHKYFHQVREVPSIPSLLSVFIMKGS